nr:hypothetical protein [Tanacetum cinerariifolium]
MDSTGGSGSNSHVWPIVDDNGVVDMDTMKNNLKDRISNLEKIPDLLKKSTMDNSFGSAEKLDHVRILQSCNGLLLCAGWADDIDSREFTTYEMMKGCSVWSVRYLANTKELMNPLSEGWSIRSIVWSIGLGEKEDDAFLVINLFGKVVKYNLISKSINEIFYIGSNQMDDDDVEFIPPLSVDLNVYEFIQSFASV